MEDLAPTLIASAAAVAELGGRAEDFVCLQDDSLLAALATISEHESHLDSYKVWVAAEIARRSNHELGYAGLARSRGSATPEALIQSVSGGTWAEATKLVRVGIMMTEATEAAAVGATTARADETEHDQSAPEIQLEVPWQLPIAQALAAGELSVHAADAIRRGLGSVDAAITGQQLATLAVTLIAEAESVPAEKLLRRAREVRNELDADAVARGEKERADQRYVKQFRRDGMRGGSWLLPDEDGGLEIHEAFAQMLAARTGGPRFTTDEEQAAAEALLKDERTNEQILADGLVDIFRRGLDADPNVLPGSRRPAVRVIVREETLRTGLGHGEIEGSDNAVSIETVERHICDSGTVGVLFDDEGQCVNVGRDQRLFTTRQRIGLAVRDGGCRVAGCNRPPSATEAHHIDFWHRDHGKTDLADGILLCRYHHMLIHNNHWEIIRKGSTYWLKPPRSVDPSQTLQAMPSKNHLLRGTSPPGPTESPPPTRAIVPELDAVPLAGVEPRPHVA